MHRSKIIGQQENNFDIASLRVIPKKYDEITPLEARKRRNRRRGSLILNDRTNGFLKIGKVL